MPVSQSATFGINLRVLVYTTMYIGLLVSQQQNSVVLSATPITQTVFHDLTGVRSNKKMGGNLANWSVFNHYMYNHLCINLKRSTDPSDKKV